MFLSYAVLDLCGFGDTWISKCNNPCVKPVQFAPRLSNAQ